MPPPPAQAYALLLGGSALLSALTGVLAWRRRDAPGARGLVGFQAAVLLWTGTYALHWTSASTTWQQVWLAASFEGAVLAPFAVWAFTRGVTQPDRRLTAWQWVAAASVSVVTLLILLANDPGHWLFGPMAARHGHTLLSGGPWFLVAVAHSYLMVLSSFWLLLRAWRGAVGMYRAQVGLLLLGLMVPWLGNVLGILGGPVLPQLDVTPALFVVTGLLFVWAMLRSRLFDIVPMARHLVLEQMRDGVAVLDPQWRVLDLNDVARRRVIPSVRAPIGQPASAVFEHWGSIEASIRLALAEGHLPPQVELTLEAGRVLDLHLSALRGPDGSVRGYLGVWRDVTAQREVERGLRLANEQLEQQLAEIQALQVQLRDLSERDPLTRLYNRRYLEQALSDWTSAEAGPCALLLMDIDFFKRVNDTYGHPGGDEVLCDLARYLEATCPPDAVVCRYGGEEFVVVLRGMSLDGVLLLADQLLEGIRALPFTHGGRSFQVTASLGVAACPEHGREADTVMLAADQALYRAKELGRDQLCVASLQPGELALDGA